MSLRWRDWQVGKIVGVVSDLWYHQGPAVGPDMSLQQMQKELQKTNQPMHVLVSIFRDQVRSLNSSHEYEQTIDVFFSDLDPILVMFFVQIH